MSFKLNGIVRVPPLAGRGREVPETVLASLGKEIKGPLRSQFFAGIDPRNSVGPGDPDDRRSGCQLRFDDCRVSDGSGNRGRQERKPTVRVNMRDSCFRNASFRRIARGQRDPKAPAVVGAERSLWWGCSREKVIASAVIGTNLFSATSYRAIPSFDMKAGSPFNCVKASDSLICGASFALVRLTTLAGSNSSGRIPVEVSLGKIRD